MAKNKLSDFDDAFMLCIAGEGDPYIKVQFRTLERAQEFHSVLIREMGRKLRDPNAIADTHPAKTERYSLPLYTAPPERCPMRQAERPHAPGRPAIIPGPSDAPVFCVLPEGHEGPHFSNLGGPLREPLEECRPASAPAEQADLVEALHKLRLTRENGLRLAKSRTGRDKAKASLRVLDEIEAIFAPLQKQER